MTTRFTLVLLVLLAFVVGLGLGPRIAGSGAAQNAAAARTAVPRDSVAVLPFYYPKDIHDGVKHYLNGWVREVPVALLTDSGLRVARPASVKELGPIKDELMAGHRLGVATVLVGRVKVEDEGARMIVEAELLDVENGLLMWTRTWELNDIFKKVSALNGVRDDIIAGVKKRLEREADQRQPRK